MPRRPNALARHWRDTPLARVFSPMQRFVHAEASSGLSLIGATLVALTLANSPLAAGYAAVLQLELGVSLGPLGLQMSLLHWVNDGLMALFFFLVGLELKREVLVGELAHPRQALLPVVAALGGATLPALLYVAVNRGGPGAVGWGVPMATDIAFALGVLTLLGRRVPWALKVFLTAVAVIDDLFAVLVIALFYTNGLNFGALGIGLGVLALLAVVNRLGIRTLTVYVVLGFIVWIAFLESGVHATIAGVLVAFTIPARNRIAPATFLDQARQLLAQFHAGCPPDGWALQPNASQASIVLALEATCAAVQSPLQQLEARLQPWVAFGIMPLFALANADIALTAEGLRGAGQPVVLGVVVGLVLGKPIGLFVSTWLAVRLGLAHLPEGVRWRQLGGAGCLAGMGFTMSLFIATLGFTEPLLLAAAKLGILVASVTAGILGYGVLWLVATRLEDGAIQGFQNY